ncbi:hypothetical protein ACFX13_023714 [Malus domestica]
MEPTVVTYNAIISGTSLQMMIEALANEGKPRLAYELYLRAQTQRLALSSKAYDTVVQSSLESGANIDVRLLGERPPERKGNVQGRNTSSQVS